MPFVSLELLPYSFPSHQKFQLPQHFLPENKSFDLSLNFCGFLVFHFEEHIHSLSKFIVNIFVHVNSFATQQILLIFGLNFP